VKSLDGQGAHGPGLSAKAAVGVSNIPRDPTRTSAISFRILSPS
jgi:hypothetical protein